MNQETGYSQFIHGKIVGEGSYTLVAHTADLAGKEHVFQQLKKTYCFWETSAPYPYEESAQANGMFWDEEGKQLVLVQVMPAPVLEFGEAGGRVFMQHRYVFIPAHSLAALQGRLWKLFIWLMEQSIPVFYQFRPTLERLQPPQFKKMINRDEERELVRRSLELTDMKGESLLFTALGALLKNQKQRLLFHMSEQTGNIPDEVLQSMLLFLPAPLRGQFAMAAGILDERKCEWAKLILKTNGKPKTPLPDNVWWVKCDLREIEQPVQKSAQDSSTNSSSGLLTRLFGGDSPSTSTSPKISHYSTSFGPYLIRIQSMLATDPTCLAGLLQVLDEDTSTRSLKELDYSTRLALRLTKAYQDQTVRRNALAELLESLNQKDWRAYLSVLTDNLEREVALKVLGDKNVHKELWIVDIILQLSHHTNELIRFLQELNQSLQSLQYPLEKDGQRKVALGEILLERGLLKRCGKEKEDPIRREVLLLCQSVVSHKAQQGYQDQARQLQEKYLAFFLHPEEQLALLEAAIRANIMSQTDIEEFFRDRLAPVILYLPENRVTRTRLLEYLRPSVATLMTDIVMQQTKALSSLPQLANEIGMSNQLRIKLYARALQKWAPSYQDARSLLVDLLRCTGYGNRTIAQRWSWPTALGEAGKWFDAKMPKELSDALSRDSFNWQTSHRLAKALFDTRLQQVKWLDSVVKGEPLESMLREWLEVVVEEHKAWSDFEKSQTWRQLSNNSVLFESITLLCLKSPLPPTAKLLNRLDDLNRRMGLSPEIFFNLIDQIPLHESSQKPLSLNQVMALLALWLPYHANKPEPRRLLQQLKKWGEGVLLVEVFRGLLVKKVNVNTIERVLIDLPECVSSLIWWVRRSKQEDLIPGVLLHTLADSWLRRGEVEEELLTFLTTPAITSTYQPADWLAVIRLRWHSGKQESSFVGPFPALGESQKQRLTQYACQIVRTYSRAEQTRSLLDDCKAWGLDRTAQEEILKEAQPAACDVDLLDEYMYDNSKLIDYRKNRSLFRLILQQKPQNDEDTRRLNAFLTKQMKLQFEDGINVDTLKQWREMSVDKEIYHSAFECTAQWWIEKLLHPEVKSSNSLKLMGLHKESQAIKDAVLSYWKTAFK